MLTGPQADLVSHLDRLREGPVVMEGELVPVSVEPYAGQLLRLDTVAVVPAVYVDIGTATLEPDSEEGDLVATALTAEFVVCTVNQAGMGAGYSDGLALVSWLLRVVTEAPLVVDGQLLRATGPVRFRRIASDETYWAGRVSLDLQIDP